VAFVILLTHRQSDKRVEPTVANTVQSEDRSPAMMMSRLSLMLAYNRGGLDAVDEQSKKAYELLGQKNTNVSIADLLNDKNGRKPERNDL